MNIRDRNLVNQKVWIGIVVGVFFVGIAGGYAVFVSSYEVTEMMSEHDTHEPMMGSMMNLSGMEEHEMMLGIMEGVMEDEVMRQHMMAHMMEDQGFVHQMFTFMEQSPEMMLHMEAHVTGDISALEKFQGGE